MKPPPPPSKLAKQAPLKAVGGYVNTVLVDTQETMLRQVLSEKTTTELVDTLFEIVHLPDLLDFFKDDLTHYLSTQEPD